MRLTLVLPAVVAVLGLADAAVANDTPGAHKYADLPRGSIARPPVPEKRPKFVGPKEKVPGVFPVLQKFDNAVPLAQRNIMVVTDAGVATSIEKNQGFNGPADDRLCLSESNMRFGQPATDDDGNVNLPEWEPNLTWQVSLWPTSKENPQGGVAAIHTELLVETNGVATLEVASAWVDPATRGARLIDKASVPLALVGTAVGGVRVYAARTDSGGTQTVEFVVARPKSVGGERHGSGQLMAVRQDGTATSANGCGHMRVSIPVDAKSAGESAIALVGVELPSLPSANPDDEPDEAADKGDKGKKSVSLDARESAEHKAKPGRKRFTPPRMRPSMAPSAPSGETTHEAEIRTRDVEVHLGVSKTSRDKEPVIAVSFGWAGREQTERVTVPDSPKSD